MNIGQASKATGLSTRAIRLYEQMGLVSGIKRRVNTYREYSDADVARLIFIRRTRTLDFSLDQVRELLSLRNSRRRTCSQVRSIAMEKLEEIERKVALLERMASTLNRLAAGDASDRPECAIIQSLEDGQGIDDAAVRELDRAPGQRPSEPAKNDLA